MKGKILKIRKIDQQEIVLLHDFYFDSIELDAPESKFEDLSFDEKSKVRQSYKLDQHYTVINNEEILGFFGLYPDEDGFGLNIFYVINTKFRGQGYFSSFLKCLIRYVQASYVDFTELRAVTRASNLASVRGLLKESFVHAGQRIEEYSHDPKDDVEYDVYTLKI